VIPSFNVELGTATWPDGVTLTNTVVRPYHGTKIEGGLAVEDRSTYEVEGWFIYRRDVRGRRSFRRVPITAVTYATREQMAETESLSGMLAADFAAILRSRISEIEAADAGRDAA
jgi:hypothetical protein